MLNAALLRVLARLEELELRRTRLTLAEVGEQERAAVAERAALRTAVPKEILAARELPGGPAPLGAWLATARHLEQRLLSEASRLERERRALEAQVRERRAAMRRLEIASERLARREATARAASERKAADELAVIRRARPRTPERG